MDISRTGPYRWFGGAALTDLIGSRRSRFFNMSLALSCFAVTGLFGYLLGLQHEGVPHSIAARQTPSLEYFVEAQSFSEAENVRALLQGLANRLLLELRQQRYAAGLAGPGSRPQDRTSEHELHVTAAIQALQLGIEEFKGSGCELGLVQDLLVLLKAQGKGDRWLDVYLHALYRYPTRDIVGLFAKDAITIGKSAGREEEVHDALVHASTIPLSFPAKQQIADLLGRDLDEKESKLNKLPSMR
jgi:hypothetical protein